MVERGRIKFSLFVMMLLLQFAAESTQLLLYHTVRDGDEATLSCESVMNDQSNCDSTTWSFKPSRTEEEVDLVKPGQKVAETTSDRLSLTENCSLVIKKVRAEDAGRYVCKQYKSGEEQKPSGQVYLSVVSMTEQRIIDVVTLNCSVSAHPPCRRPVKWLFMGQTVDKYNKDFILSESSCSASVKSLTSPFFDWFNVFRCEVTEGVGTKLFSFRPPPPGDKPEPRQLLLYHTVRDGDEATLSCEVVTKDQSNCDSTTWSFKPSWKEEVDLVKLGQKVAETTSDRLSLTENCSLVIKKVRAEDAGRYVCKQYKSGEEQQTSGDVYLSVVSITEQKITDEVTLSCSVSTYPPCRRPVKWLLKGQTVDKDNKDFILSESSCFASVKFLTSHFIFSDSSWRNFFRCDVTDADGTKLFSFRPPPSGDKPEETTKTPTTPPRTTTETNGGAAAEQGAHLDPKGSKWEWWPFVIAAVVLAAVLVAAVMLIRWRKAKGNKTKMNVGQATPAAPGTSQDTADPEDGVSYASVTYTNKTNGKARILSKNAGDGDDAVTYATVKASSTDPNNLYATVK